MTDLVNHPPHYEEQAIKLEPIDFCERLPFCEGNALKYCFRAGHKDGASELQDLKKAQWYLKRRLGESAWCASAAQEVDFETLMPFLCRKKSVLGIASRACSGKDYRNFFYQLEIAVKNRIGVLENKKC